MKISLEWLRRYLDTDKGAEEIADALTLIGLEVEGVERTGLPPLEKVVVGEVLASEPHPNADRLSVCRVDVGAGGEPRQIVCGAKNFKVGDRVPVAVPGARLPTPEGGVFKIKKSKLRDVQSEGMMCSAKELNLGDDHAGLLILEDRPEVGTPINDVFPGGDTVLDVAVTPNRPDCLSHLGVARDLAAFWGLDCDFPATTSSPGDPFREPAEHLISAVEVESPENCPHYIAYSIRGVKIGPSPEWLQRLLKAVGLRPINNVVDVTNFVLHEIGQPLHAFDAAKIGGGKIVVRQAGEGEKITTLDDKERTLDPRSLVIADAEKPLVVAGVMGSVDAEVDAGTTDIVLEAAYFNPANIRWTSRQLGLASDSSYRFERGVDPKGVDYAALRAIDLILETAGGTLAGPPLVAGESPLVERVIVTSPDFVRARIGFEVEDSAIEEAFAALLLNVSKHQGEDGNEEWHVEVPSFRLDLDRPVDLVEEFLRIHGTDKIPEADVVAVGLGRDDDPLAQFTRRAAGVLQGQGYNECIHYTTTDGAALAAWFPGANAAPLGLANPLLSDQGSLRTSLLPGLLDALRLNQNHKAAAARLFENGRVFREREGQLWELVSVAFVLRLTSTVSEWLERAPGDFFTARNLVDHLLRAAGADPSKLDWRPVEEGSAGPWQPGHAAAAGNPFSGVGAEAGLLNLRMVKGRDLDGAVLAGTATFTPEFLGRPRPRPTYTPFSQQPPVLKDLALVVEADTFAETVRRDLERVAAEAAGAAFDVESVRLFDVFQGGGLPEGKKSLAFSLLFRSRKETLTDKVVNRALATIQEKIAEGTGYAVRA